jgi:hypothetical protein
VPKPLLAISSKVIKTESVLMALARGNFHAFIVGRHLNLPYYYRLIRCKESIIVLFRAPAASERKDDFLSTRA